MRILVVGIAWPTETFLQRLIDGLTDRGHEVITAYSRKPSDFPKRAKNLSRIVLYNSDLRWWEKLVWLLRYVPPCLLLRPDLLKEKGLGRRLLNVCPFAPLKWDVTYFPWNTSAIQYEDLFHLEPPVIVSCRGAQINVAPHNPRRADLREGLRRTFHKAHAVHCVSRDISEKATALGLDPQKIRVISPAINCNEFTPGNERDFFSEKDKSTGEIYPDGSGSSLFEIFSIGSLIWRKGYEYALLAVHQLKQKGIPLRYRIIGEGPDRQRLRFAISDFELEREVDLVGALTPNSVREGLQKSHVFFLTSLSEGISNAVLEAMACGLPIVTTDCGGMREAVTDGIEGYVTPVRDPEAAAAALLKLVRDSESRERMGLAARQRVKRDFSLDRQIRDFEEMFQEASHEHG